MPSVDGGLHLWTTWHSRVVSLTSRDKAVYRALLPHLRQAVALRRCYPDVAALRREAVAVFSPGGRCLHVEEGGTLAGRKALLAAHERFLATRNGLRDSSKVQGNLEGLYELLSQRWSFVDSVRIDGVLCTVAVQAPAHAGNPVGLTPRERDASLLAARGYSDGEIACALEVALSSASTYVKRALAKLPVHNRFQVIEVFAGLRSIREHTDSTLGKAVLLESRGPSPAPPPPLSTSEALTEEELGIYRLVVNGRSRQSIANRLKLSRPQINRRVHSIYRKFGVSSREALLYRHLMHCPL